MFARSFVFVALILAIPPTASAQRATFWPATVTPRNPAEVDDQAVTLGLRFKSDVVGTVTGIRFWKGTGNVGTHVGSLWTLAGTKLASATFTNETATGWQEVAFPTPVAISANTLYVASYFAPKGRYAADDGAFAMAGIDRGGLHAPSAGNGCYAYSASDAFPSLTYHYTNYYVDVVFLPGSTTPDPNPLPTPIPTPTPPAVTGVTYYIGPGGSTGDGSQTRPYGVVDLLTSTGKGPALSKLNPGDQLIFLAGDYHFRAGSGGEGYLTQIISPVRSGTATDPITLRSAPGATVNLILDSGQQPLFGTTGPTLNYVRFVGFSATSPAAPRIVTISGTGNEVSYCELVGGNVATIDNHDGIRIEGANAARIHHNLIRGVTGNAENSAGIKLYTSANVVIEDNYITANTCGIFDKDSGKNNTFRRNWITGNTGGKNFLGNGQGSPATLLIYDNVIDGFIDLSHLSTGDQVYNNLIRINSGSTQDGRMASIYNDGGNDRTLIQNQVWNNVTLGGGAAMWAWNSHTADSFSVGLSTSPLTYMDYNVYDGTPGYLFERYGANTQMTLAQMQAKGFETHSRVAAPGSVYNSSWTLAAAYATAGRDGGPVGPRVSVASLMDRTRYGPKAAK